MKSTENGLFSRCCYYVFENNSELLKCFNRLDSKGEIDNEFAKYSARVLEYYELLLAYDRVNTIFREDQLSKIQEILQNEFKMILPIKELHASIKRSFITVQKIATILCALEKCEKSNVEEQQFCNDLYLNVALTLTLTFLGHSYKAFELLPRKVIELSPAIGVSHQRLFAILPNEFTRGEAISIGKEIGLPLRTVDYILNTLAAKEILEHFLHGKYRKAKNS